jgi:hypothetical protein
MLLAYIDSIEPLVASTHAQMQMKQANCFYFFLQFVLLYNMSQRRLDTYFKLKSDTQQPTPDKDKGDRDINVSEAISEGISSGFLY